jgi:hypothetical protein
MILPVVKAAVNFAPCINFSPEGLVCPGQSDEKKTSDRDN